MSADDDRMGDEGVVAFKAACEEYVNISRALAEQAKTAGVLRRTKNEYSELIMAFLRKNNYEQASVKDASLVMKDSKRTETMSKDLIKDVLQKHGLDATKILEDIQSARKTSVKQVISIKKK